MTPVDFWIELDCMMWMQLQQLLDLGLGNFGRGLFYSLYRYVGLASDSVVDVLSCV
jgi:hypothetical protein